MRTMNEEGRHAMKDEQDKAPGLLGFGTNLMDHFRQLRFPEEFRISMPRARDAGPGGAAAESLLAGQCMPEPPGKADRSTLADNAVAEVSTCLWYLKTRYFRQDWTDMNAAADDGRVRRAIGRLNKTITSLRDAGIEIDDPIRQRYPENGDATMKPVQLVPTEGISAAVVTETATPIVYRNGRIIQRGEVYVAVPKHADDPPSMPADAQPEATGSGDTKP